MKMIIALLIALDIALTVILNLNNNSKLDTIMSKQDQINASLEQLDEATNAIAAELQKVRDEVAAGTVSDESITRLDSAVAKLKALGADETNPVPAPSPAPEDGGVTV